MLRRPLLWTGILRTPSPRLLRHVSSVPPLIRIEKGTFYQRYPTPDDAATGQNPPLFPNLNFVLPAKPESLSTKEKDEPQQQQHWAVIGSSGRTSFLDVFRGQYICDPPTARSYPFLLTDEIAEKDPRLRFVGNAVQYIGFSGEGSGAIGGTRGAYLSARYESHREETDWTVEQYLKGQTELNPLEGFEDGKVKDKVLLDQVISDLRLKELLDMPVANLSNGQTRRARIAKALLSKPELLLLDDPFMGLDPATVRGISGFLHQLAAKSSPRLILALRPQDIVPDWITHVIILGNNNRVLLQGSRAEVNQALEVWRRLPIKNQTGLRPGDKKIYAQAADDMEKGFLDKQLLWDLDLVKSKADKTVPAAAQGGEPLIEMDGVRVQYGDKVVLGNWEQDINGKKQEGLHWTVRRGERWVVLGANGSGKTTLLSMITSDHPQAYAMPLKLLGRSRLPEPGKPGISLFELQSRMGHSSPEIHAFFPRQLTIRQSIESAFADTFLSRPKLNHDRDLDVSAALRFFKAELDPDAASPTKENPPSIESKSGDAFPDIGLSHRMQKQPYFPTDYDVDYADTVTFGQLSTAQQRVVLFIRALIHKPDIIILDEALSSMPASTRDKCIAFLETGETIPPYLIPPPGTRRSKNEEPLIKGFNSDPATIRHTGISENQALIMISHVKEEIPDIIRHYMRLPSDPGDGAEPLDFRLGVLAQDWVMSDPAMWERVWSPPSVFDNPFKAAKFKPAMSPEKSKAKEERAVETEKPEVKTSRRGKKKAEQPEEPEQKTARGRKQVEEPEEPEQKGSRRRRSKKTEESTEPSKGRGRPKKAE
ncbi:putative ABC transporter [Aspergillus chevalieri]|uniref:ABC transporter domain-containing protein n=1 Tax=Aspergillus chevalieri TaxID=182096 RepID=A0A7R7VT23_ASPCH|nr:uncharacterized protein ACHE_60103A [Aspergillus chevalieri]BCR90217.1 hypothetical protein ACHE_60103A [Aspergillus chevalieri]